MNSKIKIDFNFVYASDDHKILDKLNNLMLTKFTDRVYFDEVVGVKKKTIHCIMHSTTRCNQRLELYNIDPLMNEERERVKVEIF